MAGYLRTESGVGAAARGYVAGLQALGIDMALEDLSNLSGNRSEDQTLRQFNVGSPYDVNLICADVEPHFAIVSQLGPDFFEGRYNVGVWAWELARFPEKWYDRFAYYDEIWVGTSFIANALSPVSPTPVVRLPPVLAPAVVGSREAARRRLDVTADEFVFLFVFDVHSHLERKNPLAVIEAFRCAFSPSEPVRLVLKSVNARAAPHGFAKLLERAQQYRISVIDGYWPAQEVRNLMSACDAYISLHRAEGTGLTITDAMALGKPVIATGWSGNMDFMTVANSFPVEYELVEIDTRIGPYAAGEIWAEPSVEHAAGLMRRVFENREEARKRGELARRELEADYSSQAVSKLLSTRFEAIDVRRDLGQFRQRMWGQFWEYRSLAARIRDVVRETVPPEATVLVVTKGDDALLELDGRPAWHFPQTDAGVYAGAHPIDSREAISHLDALQARGGEFLLFPSTALWWLEHYREFKQYLDSRHRQVFYEPDTCRIYSLKEADL